MTHNTLVFILETFQNKHNNDVIDYICDIYILDKDKLSGVSP